MRASIRQQTMLLAFIPMVLLVISLDAFFLYGRVAALQAGLMERAELLAKQLASSSEYSLFSGNINALNRETEAAMAQKDVIAISVIDESGKVLSYFGNPAFKSESESVNAYGKSGVVLENKNYFWLKASIVSKTIELNEFDLGTTTTTTTTTTKLGEVLIKVSKLSMQNASIEMIGVSLLISLGIFALSAIFVVRYSDRIVTPVLALNTVARRIGQGDLDVRLSPAPVIRELNELALSINQMAKQLNVERTFLKQLNQELEERIETATRVIRLKKEDAENANYDKTRFLAAASHDLRQPMHALSLFVGELSSKLTSPEQTRLVSKIEESVEALSNLLDALLDISKLDAGVVTGNVSVFSIENLLARVARNYGSLAHQKGVTLRVVSHQCSVQSDPILLERIVGNLVSNAIRYTPMGGKVLLGCRHRAGLLRIEIRDNGIGIEAAEQENIFREFFQVANQERDRSKGLGLGLAIVSRLATLLGHHISVRSEINKGSVFAIAVPMASVPVASIIQAPLEQMEVGNNQLTDFDKLNVLIVDDDPLVRGSTQGIFESWGCHVSMAESVAQVVEFLGKTDYDLVICDYRLPDGNGIQIAAWIKTNLKVQPAFILVSGDTSPEVLRLVQDNGIQLLNKPVRLGKMRTLIQHLLRGKAA